MRKRRDRRVPHKCSECNEFFMGRLGQRGISKWCSKCEEVKLSCAVCKKEYLLRRKFFIFRGGKLCSMTCYGIWRSQNYWGAKIANWKGGVNHVIAYRARKALASGTHTLQDWEKLKKIFANKCLACDKLGYIETLEEDHIVPISKGGSNDISNIQPLCRSCNARKHTKTIDYRPKISINS